MNTRNDLFWLQENELLEVLEIIKSGNIVQGTEVAEFEKEFARYIGASYAVSVSTGTAGLHIALQALNNERNSKIITTPLSFVASANSILYIGSIPVFADIELPTLNIDPIFVKSKLDSNTNGVVGVHLYGHPFKIKEMTKLCKDNDAFLVEDCAQALGATYEGKNTGTFGDAGVFSFYDTKHLKLGEGGMIITNKKGVMKKCSMIRSHGASKQYRHEYLGYNYRLNEVFAKIGRIQLKKIKRMINARRERAKIYFESLANIDNLALPPITKNITHAFYRFPVLMNKKSSKRSNLILSVRKRIGIDLHTGYPCPIYKQPLYQEISKRLWLSRYRKFPQYNMIRCRNTELAIKSLIELPVDPWIPEDEIVTISKALRQSLNQI
ncbi:MAG: DegT/DnrJ/EryC1/StrS family aminotransferase [Nitrosopumilaceae archaeon]